MAVVKCKECGGQVSTKAKTCPTCGAKAPKQTSRLTWLILICILGLVALAAFSPKPPLKSAEQIAQEAAQAKKQAEADAVRQKERDAEQVKYSAIAAGKAAIVKRLNDPESAKFGQVVFREPGFVCGYVNAKNGFGGYTGEKGFITLGSAEMSWFEGDKDFEKVWNKNCASK